MDSWDPAFLDHQSRSFNSYQEGDPGSVMQNCTESGTKTVNLYVGQVPDGIKENDSIVLKSYAKIKFKDKHADPIISLLKEHDFPDDRENIKNYLISSLGKLKNPRIYPFLKELYVEAYDKPKTQTAILRTLLKHKEKDSYEMILELLEKDYPVKVKELKALYKK